MAANPKPDQSHVKALDGVRFFAFLAVFVYHAAQGKGGLREWTAHGALGVQVFFVLSGFLIGDILLGLRDQATPLGHRLRIFYIRRALRIFPLYYATLLVLAALPLVGITLIGGNDIFWWNATYLNNVAQAIGVPVGGGHAHFWSLAVEEHFYLIAPLAILTLSRRGLAAAFVVIWVGCAIVRLALGDHPGPVLFLSPLQFDCLTIGLAAAFLHRDGSFLGLEAAGAGKLAIACAVAWAALTAAGHLHVEAARLVLRGAEYWLVGVATAGLVLTLWRSSQGPVARLFALPPLASLGKVSYALYVFHLPCLILVPEALKGYVRHGALPALAATVLLAALSWRLLERPFNDLKRRFPYQAREPRPESRAAVAGS